MDLIRFFFPFLSPLPVILILLCAGMACWVGNRRKTGAAAIGASLVILIVSGYGIVTREEYRRLERSYAPLLPEAISSEMKRRLRFVVVLGSGHHTDDFLPATSRIGVDSLYRLVEGIRIHRSLPKSKLVVSGGPLPGDSTPNATVVGRTAEAIGIPAENIILESRPKSTYSEAKLLKGLLKEEPFVLVTSAAHMKRAVQMFQAFGMQPIPAPTDYRIKESPGWTVKSILPSCGNLGITQRVIYEWLGELWGRWKGVSKNSRS